ncbi:MAG: hypothetical protein JNM33_02745 [Rubrivivax sp.]|nr:hypothetical protein [Rubrivivax sp.]
MPRLPGLMLMALLLPGCAALTSSPSQDGELGEGLTYYLPKKDIQVTVVVTGDAVSTVSLATTPAYPDLRQAFVLRNGPNALGKTANTIGVGANGLLKSTKATVTSGVSDAASSLAGIAGSVQAGRVSINATRGTCGNGTHVFLYPVTEDKEQTACGLKLTIKRLTGAEARAEGSGPRPTAKALEEAYSGLYYRQAEPFLVTVDGTIKTAAILYSPSVAPLKSLPIARTFFADGDAAVTLDDGVPTQYDQTTDGELVALLKLPATIIAAYFEAIGKLFDAFKTRDAKQAEDMSSSIKLELAKAKYEACLKAIQTKDNDMIVKLDCGK